jgi:hypothetical protein
MRRRVPSAFLLAGAVLLLASLYLPWQQAACRSPSCSGGFGGRFVAETQSVDGWSSQVGGAAALVAVLLACAAGATFIASAAHQVAAKQLVIAASTAGGFSIPRTVNPSAAVKRCHGSRKEPINQPGEAER